MNAQKGKLLREGKAKILYETDHPHRVIQFFKDDATAFNAQKRSSIAGKGEVNNSVSTWIFEYLEAQGIPTHFIKKLSPREMLARKVEIIPVEVVVRYRAAGSIVKRLGLEKGRTFRKPLVEFYFKEDALGDPLVTSDHVIEFGWATPNELESIRASALSVGAALRVLFDRAGLELVDFKLEFGRDAESKRLLLADEFSPDGCRLWDRQTGESKDKDRFRHDLGGVQEAYMEVYERLGRVLEKI